MSDNFIRLMPFIPNYVPPADKITKAVGVLSSVFPDLTIEATVYPEVRFWDPGGNLEDVYCPCCGAQLDLAWWGKAMDQSARDQFVDLSVVAPCCGCETSLNDLQYRWPVGFARFCITISNPPFELEKSVMEAVGHTLGTDLRGVWIHY